MADVAFCSKRSIKRIRSKIHYLGTPKAPYNGVGRRRSTTPPMLHALQERLLEKPGLYSDEMALFPWDEYKAVVSKVCISRALESIKWTKKEARNISKERNADL